MTDPRLVLRTPRYVTVLSSWDIGGVDFSPYRVDVCGTGSELKGVQETKNGLVKIKKPILTPTTLTVLVSYGTEEGWTGSGGRNRRSRRGTVCEFKVGVV